MLGQYDVYIFLNGRYLCDKAVFASSQNIRKRHSWGLHQKKIIDLVWFTVLIVFVQNFLPKFEKIAKVPTNLDKHRKPEGFFTIIASPDFMVDHRAFISYMDVH